jgi:S-adenosylmethionine synthetase
MKNYFLFTSEAVAEGHPDKVCDQISDAILDLYFSKDPFARVACETMATTNVVKIAGEIKTTANITNKDIEETVRNTIKDIGYEQEGFHWRTVKIENLLHAQSSDIAMGVDKTNDKEEGAGDQGLMFGYANDETETYMPAAIYYCNRLLENIMKDIKNGKVKDLGPDAKTQITLEYKNGRPTCANTVLVSIQHKENNNAENIKNVVLPYIKSTLPSGWVTEKTRILINPTGKFVIGGPDGDSGLTGRKIIVDTYGGYAPHGGGAFSGKDPTKVDRSAAYITRYLAKNVVAAGLAKECLIQVSYAIGIAEPISFYVNTKKTGIYSDTEIQDALESLIDLKPQSIREILQLNKPIYKKTATYGHFGRTPEKDGCFSWEKTDLVPSLKKYFEGKKKKDD